MSSSQRPLLIGLAASVLLVIGAVLDLESALRSYLVAYLYVLGFGLGPLALILLHNASGGAWGVAIRRICEAAMRTLPVLAVGFLPIALGMGYLYPWADAELVATDHLLQHKRPFLNPTFFCVAAAAWFAVWILLARFVDAKPKDASGADPYPTRTHRKFAGACLALYILTMTFAAFHWGMSLEPHWFSTIYGLAFVIGQALSGMILALWILARQVKTEPMRSHVTAGQFNDLGNLLLALVMLWAYLALSQYLIIWSANLAEEASWYVARTGHGWQVLAQLLIGLHFAVPFAVLLSRRSKRMPNRLALVAGGLIVLRAFDLFWNLAPAFHPHGFHLAWTDPVAVIGAGALWYHLFRRNLALREPDYRPVAAAAEGAEAEAEGLSS